MGDDLRYLRNEVLAATRDLLCQITLIQGVRRFDEWTLDRAADLFGLTRERIRQIEARGLRLLRHPHRAQHLRMFVDDDSSSSSSDGRRDREVGHRHTPRLSDEWGTSGRFAVNSRVSVDSAIRMAIRRSDGHERFYR